VAKQVPYEVCQLVPETVCPTPPAECSSCDTGAAPYGAAKPRQEQRLKPAPETTVPPKKEPQQKERQQPAPKKETLPQTEPAAPKLST